VNLKKFWPFLFAFVLPLLVVYAWWGGFNPVQIEETIAGPYTYAYLESTGDYSKLPDKVGEVRATLRAAGIAAGKPITVLYSNPDLVNVGNRRARIGFLVSPGSKAPLPLEVDTIPVRLVLRVQVRAGGMLAPGRAYAALDKYLQARGKGIQMPTVEVYETSDALWRMGLLSVEMERK
jgi:effector-binding domain-containing protein